MSTPIQRGMFRLWLVLSVLWIAGMGWYQYQQSQQAAHHELTIQFSKDSALHMEANTPEDKNEVRDRWLWVFLPPVLLLLLFPVGTWLASGFKPEGK